MLLEVLQCQPKPFFCIFRRVLAEGLDSGLRFDNRITQGGQRGEHFSIGIRHRRDPCQGIGRFKFILQVQRHFLGGLLSHTRDATQQITFIGKDSALITFVKGDQTMTIAVYPSTSKTHVLIGVGKTSPASAAIPNLPNLPNVPNIPGMPTLTP